MTNQATSSRPTTPTARTVLQTIDAASTLEGGGITVNRPFPGAALDVLDPFLLLDEMAPTVHEPGDAGPGVPPHPHRGFETVTYVIAGEVEHRDSAGNHGIIGPGDVQWMTAGDGIVHSEMPSERIRTDGGLGHGLQLWVNLPAHLRRTPPSYQALDAADLTHAEGEGWTARVIAGSLLGVVGPAATHTPVGLARLTIEPGTEVRIPVPAGHTAAVYAFAGEAAAGPDLDRLTPQRLVVFDRDGGDVVLATPPEATEDFDGLVLTGEPIGQPIARYGPFVMNTKAEIMEAIDDFNAGRMGSIPATGRT